MRRENPPQEPGCNVDGLIVGDARTAVVPPFTPVILETRFTSGQNIRSRRMINDQFSSERPVYMIYWVIAVIDESDLMDSTDASRLNAHLNEKRGLQP
jgi:hypothetical protein